MFYEWSNERKCLEVLSVCIIVLYGLRCKLRVLDNKFNYFSMVGTTLEPHTFSGRIL